MFTTRQSRKHQQRHSIAAVACWLVLSLLNCSALAEPVAEAEPVHGHHMEMAEPGDMGCCESPQLSCCEPATQAVPSKYTDVEQKQLPLVAVRSISAPSTFALPAPSPGYYPGWELQYSPPGLNLLHCRILV